MNMDYSSRLENLVSVMLFIHEVIQIMQHRIHVLLVALKFEFYSLHHLYQQFKCFSTLYCRNYLIILLVKYRPIPIVLKVLLRNETIIPNELYDQELMSLWEQKLIKQLSFFILESKNQKLGCFNEFKYQQLAKLCLHAFA